MRKDAVLSDDGRYRYLLSRTWDDSLPVLGWVMLNPSTADATQDDPTIRKCIGFARRNGYGGIVVANVFAYRATNPKDLPKDLDEAFGERNKIILVNFAKQCKKVIAGWGSHKAACGVAEKRVLYCCQNLWCLGTNASGSPKHPLFVPYTAPIVKYRSIV